MALHWNETAFPADRELLCFCLSATQVRVRPSGAWGLRRERHLRARLCAGKQRALQGWAIKKRLFPPPGRCEQRCEELAEGDVCWHRKAALSTVHFAPVKTSRDIPVKKCASYWRQGTSKLSKWRNHLHRAAAIPEELPGSVAAGELVGGLVSCRDSVAHMRSGTTTQILLLQGRDEEG